MAGFSSCPLLRFQSEAGGCRMAITSLVLTLILAPPVSDEIRVDLDRRDDAHVKARLDGAGYAIVVEVDGYLQKLEPATIRMETQQKGSWGEPRLDIGRYLKTQFDPEKPQEVRIETTLVFDLG